VQSNGDWLWMPQRLRFAPSAQDWAVHAWPFTHSALVEQSWAPVAPPGHDPPLATVWHAVDALDPFSVPQQTWPLAQSHCWVQPKVTAKKPVHPVALALQLHVPTTVPPERPVGLKQHTFDRRSHSPSSPQVGTT
jgi:hypothetical protein